MTRFRILAVIGLIATITIGLGWSVTAEIDYSKIPPEPGEVHAELLEAKATLGAAVQAAVSTTGGLVQSAVAETTNGKTNYSIVVFTEAELRRITVDGESGEITMNEADPPFEFPGDPADGEFVTTDSGLQYVTLRPGTGPSPSGPTSTVRVHYSGWTIDGKQFDSSVARGEPINFPLNRVIAGWTEGVGSMRVGEKRKLMIPYQLAYGERGRPPAIPPKALLIFDVELLEIVAE